MRQPTDPHSTSARELSGVAPRPRGSPTSGLPKIGEPQGLSNFGEPTVPSPEATEIFVRADPRALAADLVIPPLFGVQGVRCGVWVVGCSVWGVECGV